MAQRSQSPAGPRWTLKLKLEFGSRAAFNGVESLLMQFAKYKLREYKLLLPLAYDRCT